MPVKFKNPAKETFLMGFVSDDGHVWELSLIEQPYPFGVIAKTYEVWKWNENNLVFVACFAEKRDAIDWFEECQIRDRTAKKAKELIAWTKRKDPPDPKTPKTKRQARIKARRPGSKEEE